MSKAEPKFHKTGSISCNCISVPGRHRPDLRVLLTSGLAPSCIESSGQPGRGPCCPPCPRLCRGSLLHGLHGRSSCQHIHLWEIRSCGRGKLTLDLSSLTFDDGPAPELCPPWVSSSALQCRRCNCLEEEH